MATLSTAPAWQRERALAIHAALADAQRDIDAGALTASAAIARASATIDGRQIAVPGVDGRTREHRTLRASEKTLWRLRTQWLAQGRAVESLLPKYAGAGSHTPVPEALVAEIQRRATQPTGGRDKHARSPVSAVHKRLRDEWAGGQSIPGVGTWRDWWATDPRTRHLPIPAVVPQFPWCERTIRRHCGSQALRSMGNIGAAAAAKHLPHLTLDYSRLRKAELYTLDDVRLDLVAINELTGDVVEVYAYIFMEVASRSIVAAMVKPKGAVKAADVDELVARSLQTPGYGIGVGYTTHIIFERGSVACSEAAQAVLEGASGGRIKIHRTGMTGGIRWTGQAADRAKGNAQGKAVIESFNRQLHYRLLHLPGQRGNIAANSPANLGIQDRADLKPGSRKDSTVHRAETIARIKAHAAAHGEPLDLRAEGILTFSRVRTEVQAALDAHNADPGHAYQGHTRRTEAEVAPGVWISAD